MVAVTACHINSIQPGRIPLKGLAGDDVCLQLQVPTSWLVSFCWFGGDSYGAKNRWGGSMKFYEGYIDVVEYHMWTHNKDIHVHFSFNTCWCGCGGFAMYVFFCSAHLWEYRHVSLVCTYKEKCVCIYVSKYIKYIKKRWMRQIVQDNAQYKKQPLHATETEVTRMLVWSQSPMWMTCCFFPFTSTRPGILGVNHGCPRGPTSHYWQVLRVLKAAHRSNENDAGYTQSSTQACARIATWDLWIFLGLF